MENLVGKRSVSIDHKFWNNKRVFLTGHSGFKGGWLSMWLTHMGAIVRGYSLVPNTEPSLFKTLHLSETVESIFGDVRDLERLSQTLSDFRPEIVIHMAAQPLVLASYQDPVETFETNVMGTVNILEACRNCPSVRSIVNVTTDKCYENDERLWGFREDDPMGGADPYSSSKGCSEIVSSAFRRSFFSGKEKLFLATARAGNVIGGGDWAENRLIPDILRAFELGETAIIRNPKATRPWQHVLEPLRGYLMLAERQFNGDADMSDAWNFGPEDTDVKPVEWIVERMVCLWKGDAQWKLKSQEGPHEAGYLKLDISKAKAKLGWAPIWGLENALEKIIDWHEAFISGENMTRKTIKQIKQYENFMEEMGSR